MPTLTSIYSFIKHAQGDTPWTTEVNGNYDSLDSELARPRRPFNSPVVGATTTCDLSLARTFVFTVSQATTLAFTNVPSASFRVEIELIITNGSAFALTFPGSVTWLAGGIHGFQVSGVDAVRLVTKDGGTTWYAWPTIIPRQACRVFNSAAQSVASGAGFTILTFNSESFDQGGLHSTGVNTGRITIVIPGLYLLVGSSQFANNATGLRQTIIEKNTSGSSAVVQSTPGDATYPTTHNLHLMDVAVAGDFYEIKVAQTSGGPLNANPGGTNGAYFMAVRLW